MPLTAEEMLKRISDISKVFPYLVYEENGEVVGYCYAHEWKSREAYRHTLETTVYISALHTGRGIGVLLMRQLIEDCRARGFRALIACITEGNAHSVTLHERLGFHRVSRFEQVGFKFGEWLNVVDYELLLS